MPSSSKAKIRERGQSAMSGISGASGPTVTWPSEYQGGKAASPIELIFEYIVTVPPSSFIPVGSYKVELKGFDDGTLDGFDTMTFSNVNLATHSAFLVSGHNVDGTTFKPDMPMFAAFGVSRW
jgi:hypothetical protein